MGYTIIFATHKSEGLDPIGHAWVGVEFPKYKWTIRGFYPKGDFTLSGVISQPGTIMDDYERLTKEKLNLRTKTFRDLTEEAVHASLQKIIEYGGRLHPPKYTPGRGRNKMPSRNSAPSTDSDAGYGLLVRQCAVFALDVCKAAGLDPIPFIPPAPVFAWEYLGLEGQVDALQMPKPFGNGSS